MGYLRLHVQFQAMARLDKLDVCRSRQDTRQLHHMRMMKRSCVFTYHAVVVNLSNKQVQI